MSQINFSVSHSKEPKAPSTQSILRKEAKHASVYTVSTFITQLGSFILIPLFWKKLTPIDYGIIGVTEILCSFLGVFWGLSLEVSITRFYYEWAEDVRKIKLGSVWITAWTSAIVLGTFSIVLLSFANKVIFPDVQFYPYVFLGLTHGIMGRMRQITFSTIRIKQMPWLYFGYSIAIFTISMAANITFVIFLNWGLFGYFIAWNISELVLLIACTILMLRFATPCIRSDGLKEAIKFALPLIPNNIVGSLSSVSDRYILQRFASLEALGIYSICVKFANIIILVSDALKMSFAPFIFKSVSEEGKGSAHKIGRIRMYYLLPIFIAGLALVFFIEPFVRIINRPAYFPVVKYVPLLVGSSIILVLFPYFASGLLLAKRTDLLLIPTLVQLVLVLVGGIFLIPKLQLFGIVLSRYVASIAFVTVGIYFSQKHFPIPIDKKKVGISLLFVVVGITLSQIIQLNIFYLDFLLNIVFFILLSLALAITIVGPRALHKECRRWLSAGVPFLSK